MGQLGRYSLRVHQTIATVVAEERYFPTAEAAVWDAQARLRDYIRRDVGFLHALVPYEPQPDAPEIARLMAQAARRAGVGPMAAVAGAIAASAVDAMVAAGATHAAVNNGGDSVMVIDRPVTIGIFAGPSPVKNLGLRFDPRPGPIAVCTSSGTVGHSLSFGRADAATVIGADGPLADAVATALGNRIRRRSRDEVHEALEAQMMDGIEALIVIAGDVIGVCGNLPHLVRVPVDVAQIPWA